MALTCAGADDFLPVLIYVVIHANPPQLASNLEYIQRFRMHARMASESAYFFTQLVSTMVVVAADFLHASHQYFSIYFSIKRTISSFQIILDNSTGPLGRL